MKLAITALENYAKDCGVIIEGLKRSIAEHQSHIDRDMALIAQRQKCIADTTAAIEILKAQESRK